MRFWALLGLLWACQRQPRPERLSLYCSAQPEWCEELRKSFQAETGIRVSMIRKSSGEAYAQLWAERRSPKADVWWGGTGDGHVQAAEAGLLEPYQSPRLPELFPWAQDPAGGHRTTGIYSGVLGFGWNQQWLEKQGNAPPPIWADLADSRIRGELQIANPNSSGTAYTALITWVTLLGEDRAFEYLRALHPNVNQYTKSGAAPIRAAARGETGVGVVFLHDAATEKRAGFPIEYIAPAEGTGYEVGCVSLVRGARHPRAARKFIDWALSPDAQALGAQVNALQVPSNRYAPLPPGAPNLEAIKLLPIDFGRFGKKTERARLLQRWGNEVQNAAR